MLSKKKESAEDHKAQKAIEALTKQAIKTDKSMRPLPEAVDRPGGSHVTMNTGYMVVDCSSGTVSLHTPMLVSVYNNKGK